MLAAGIIELGPSDNISLDQPRVAMELIEDVDPSPGVQWESVGPGIFNTFLLDTGANSVLAMATAVSDLEGPPFAYETEGRFVEKGVAGDHPMDVSAAYRLDYAGTSGERHTVTQRSNFGKHDGLDDQATLVDPTRSWGPNDLQDMILRNLDDGSEGLITANTATTITAVLADGAEDLWDVGDRYDIVWGTHDGSDDQAVLADSKTLWSGDQLVGMVIINLDDGSSGLIESNTANTITAGLSGGTENDWDRGDRYDVVPLDNTRILSDPDNDFSIFGPWGIVGMPAMVNRVTSLDVTGWSGGGTGLEDLYMKVDFAEQVPADEGHRYAIPVDNRLAFQAADGVVSGDPPVWGDVPFLTAVPTHHGIGQEGNFLFDTGAQISVISERLAIQLGLDSSQDGKLDRNDDSFVTTQQVGGVGGVVEAPVFSIDGVHVPATQVSSGDDVELVWTDLQWLVLDIETGEDQPSLDGVFGSDLLTSGWFHAFFHPGQPDGYIDRAHFDFTDMDKGSGMVYLDLNASVDSVIVPGPGIRLRQTARSTDVEEGGATDTYSVVLGSAPMADVTIELGSANGQVTAVKDANNSTQLVFTDENWATPQVVRVSAVDDDLDEGTHAGVITHTLTSTDDDYKNLSVPNITVNVIDNDISLITITSGEAGQNILTSIDVDEGGKTTYWLRLNEPPPAFKTYYVQLADAASPVQVEPINRDGGPFDPTDAVAFTDANWDEPQAVEVTGVDDSLLEGPHQTQIVHKVQEIVDLIQLVTLGQSTLPVNINDNDLSGVVITETDGGTSISEAGGTDTYQVALATEPTGEVQLAITADVQTEVSVDGTSFSSSQVLTFHTTAAQTITVRAVDESVDEGDHTGDITHAVTGTVIDPKFPVTLSIDDVIAAIADNDSAGLKMTEDQAGQNVITSVNVAEGNAEATYWVALGSQPTENVSIFLGSSKAQVSVVDDDPDDELEFTPANWSTPRRVHVNAVDDAVVEGAHSEQIIHRAVSGDPKYRGDVLLVANVADNDLPPTVGITRAGANPTHADTVVFQLTFSKDMQNVGFSDFLLERSGVTAAALTAGDVTDAGDTDAKTYQLTVSNVAGDGTLGLEIARDTDITDLAGNTLNQTPTTDDSYTVDNSAPSTTLTFPVDGHSYNETSWTDRITGTASDTGGASVAQVKVSIKQDSTGQYFNGTNAFDSNSEILVAATGATSWSLSFAGSGYPVDGTYTVRAHATDTAGNEGSTATATFTYDAYDSDRDQDGVSDDVEGNAPNNGDGNGDGIADNQQDDVASFPNSENGGYVTIVAPPGTTLHDVTATGSPSPSDAPAGVSFPVGFFDYVIRGVEVGGSAIVNVYPESGTVVNTYYQYGPTPNDPTDHWYPFMYDGETGAIVYADRIKLHFVDGKRGDDDVSANGEIADPGAPGRTARPWQNSALPEDVNCDALVTPLDALLLINAINLGRGPELPDSIQGADRVPIYPDVSGNDALTAEDVLLIISYINSRLSGSSVQPEGEAQAAINRDAFAWDNLFRGNTEAGQAGRYVDPAPIFPSALATAGDTNGLWAVDCSSPRRELQAVRSYRTGSRDDILADWPAIVNAGSSGEHLGGIWRPVVDESDAVGQSWRMI